MKMYWNSSLVACLMTSCAFAGGTPPAGGVLKIDPSKTVHATCRRNLIGSNIALWNQPWELSDSDLRDYVRELAPAMIRIPGGSWANHYIWNGNGIRNGETFDLSKLKDGVWDIDFSGYAPGFNIEGDARLPARDQFHGSWHVKQLHDFVEAFGAKAIVTVNVGTGTPELAAEWVRWANKKNDYNVRYWELGNELEGRWELGHILPDGSEITGEIYAQRFLAFANAMKAVDPTIKVGGPASSNDRGAFIKELLRDAGDSVDFISFHTYPVKNRQKSEKEFFDEIFRLEPALDQINRWIAQYQPERKDKIEVGITEWNSKVVEDRDTADLMNGLWCSIWIGEMFRNGVSFANQWDMMTATETGGHGLFYFEQFNFEQSGVPQKEMDRQFQSFDPPCIPKGQYWALWLWSRFMGDEMVASSLSNTENLYTAVTRSAEGLQVLLVNTSRDSTAPVRLNSTEPLERTAAAVQLSHREYFWNPNTRAPQWSRRPEAVPLDLGRDATVTVPPFCALVLQIPFAGNPVDAPKAKPVGAPRIELLLQKSTAEDIPVEAWVLIPNTAPRSANTADQFANLSVEGPAALSRQQVRINEGAGRFFITPTGTGKITVTAKTGTKSARATLESIPVQSRTEILWAFEDETLSGVRSDYALSLSDTARPNQQTAAIRLNRIQPKPGSDILLAFEPIPETVAKERISGFSLDVRASHNLSCEDSSAHLQIVLQSESDHWIPIGTIPLSELNRDWKKFERIIQNHEHLNSMKWLYAVRIQLVSTRPVTGEIFIDDAGVILR
ncbi:MAG: hypothetical protein JEZ10_05225 [Verrucomicrobia bacterium]|nr:hypothetical protein [Verrucomicrobiota bacterium]